MDVFVNGMVSVGCTSNFAKRAIPCQYMGFRIPGFVNAGNGTLLAFCEGRKYGNGGDDFGPGGAGMGQHDMVMRRSTDSGRTFGNLTTIIDAVDFAPWKGKNPEKANDKGNAVWDPTPLWDSHTDTVWLFFNGPAREGDDCTAYECSTWASYSTDKGRSWQTRNISTECQRNAGYEGPGSISPGNGHGIQLSTGELIIPMYGGAVGIYGASLCISRDHGVTWRSTPFDPNVGDVTSARNCCDEIEVAELPAAVQGGPPTLYMTIRNDDCPNGLRCPGSESARQFSTSTDLGQSWKPRANVQVPDCGNKGSVLSDPRSGGGRGQYGDGSGTTPATLILSTSASCVNRVNTTIFISKDSGRPGSFVYRQLISHSGGYNTLGWTDEGMIAILYENEWTLNPASGGNPAGSHAVPGSQTISLAMVDPEVVSKRGYIPCTDAFCDADYPPPPPMMVNASVGYCRGPPPPPPQPPAPGKTNCAFEHRSGHCDGGYHNVSCSSIAECNRVDSAATCRGVTVACLGGVCSTGKPGGVLCYDNSTTRY